MSLLDGYDEIAIQQSIDVFRKEFAGALSTIMHRMNNIETELNALRYQMGEKIDRAEFNDRYFELNEKIRILKRQ